MNLSISSAVTQESFGIQRPSSLNRFRSSPHYEPYNLSSMNNYKQDNDYSNRYIYTQEKPSKFIRNVDSPLQGYPKLNKLVELKNKTISNYKTKPFGLRLEINEMIPYLNKMIDANLKFDTIVIGSLTENQFIVPLLINLPLAKLCSKPGFLFIWASSSQISQLSTILNGSNNSNWNSFRKSEELIFIPVNNNGLNSNSESLFDNNQWHCWMCITGTVRRSIDSHLIHCNVDTDLKIENNQEAKSTSATPEFIYKLVENFASGNRRLHIVPSRCGMNQYIKPRAGWCIISPDIILNNFTINEYYDQIGNVGLNVKYDDEIEKLRPKSPVRKLNK